MSRPTSLRGPLSRCRTLSAAGRRLPARHQRHGSSAGPSSSASASASATSRVSSSSIDASEVKHFNALASTWWDPYGPSRLLHEMNPMRHDFIRSFLSSNGPRGDPAQAPPPPPPPPQALRYLDVGCGGGIFAESAARLASTAHVVGIDPSPDVVRVARQHMRQDPQLVRDQKLTYLETSIEGLAADTPRDSYDILTLFEVLEHITHPAPFLARCLPFVRPGGWLVVSTIARAWTSWFTTKLVAEYVVGLVPVGTHDWSKYIHEHELRAWFARQPGWSAGRTATMGVVYVPGLGWRRVPGAEKVGNYFLAVQRET
ncbi:MAG: Hexaprenyldihydroxybenzoate methyltransferase, mitochondrial [Phylliscum demangeonii]|nr:MAG: Hexaprenyldihydroxybenzoate methyltransferase, mitochondrial [Phylliscum demangeonii]